MNPTREPEPTTSAFLEAERMIDKTIDEMEGETHIEYGSTIERNSKPQPYRRLKLLLKRLLRW